MRARRWMRVARPWAAALAFGWASFAALPAWATDTAAPPSVTERVSVNSDFVHTRTLANGLDVVVVEQRSVPLVTIEIAVRNGAFTEPAEWNGLSHLYEHMFFKANASIPSQEAYLARQRALGMDFNGTTSEERVNYYFTLPSRNLRDGLEFMSAAIQTPLFDAAELEREREVVLGEYDRNESSPVYFLYERMNRLLWFAHPSRKDALGVRDIISTATPEQMREMQQTFYVPNNSLLVIAGDVSPDDGFALAEQVFGDWARGPDPFEVVEIPEHPPLPDDVAAVVLQPVNVTYLQWAWHGPDTRHDVQATYAADVFSFVLEQGASAFQQALVDTGVALGAQLGYQTQRYVGPITLTVVVPPGGEAAAIDAVHAQLASFTDPSYYSDEQMRAAQTLLAVSELYGQQSASSLAHTLSYWWCSASLDYHRGYVDALYGVTRDEISRYVSTYITDQPRAVVMLTSPENAEAQGLDETWLLSRVRRTR